MEYSVYPKLWEIYIVSQGFVKGNIHPAPDIPSYDHGCFVMPTMPKDVHNYALEV